MDIMILHIYTCSYVTSLIRQMDHHGRWRVPCVHWLEIIIIGSIMIIINPCSSNSWAAVRWPCSNPCLYLSTSWSWNQISRLPCRQHGKPFQFLRIISLSIVEVGASFVTLVLAITKWIGIALLSAYSKALVHVHLQKPCSHSNLLGNLVSVRRHC